MLISDFDGNNITSNVTSTKIIDGNNTESSYHSYGYLWKPNRSIQKQNHTRKQPELPNLLKYPEKGMQEIDPGQLYSIGHKLQFIINRRIRRHKKYTSIGIKTVSTKLENLNVLYKIRGKFLQTQRKNMRTQPLI